MSRMRRSHTFLLALILLAACAPRSAARPQPPPVGASDAQWVESTLDRLTLRQKAAQLVIPRIPGGFLPTDGDAWDRIRGWVQQDGIGGVIATIGPPMEQAVKFNALQELSDVPLIVTADMEHGPGQLLNGGVVLPYGLENGGATAFPPLMALGAAGDATLAYELGRITAAEARAVGVHMTYAPVVDVNNNPANPIINTRSYGADPALVARMATAHIRGLQDNGMLATAKHFPGHGDTGTDSHIELPVITVSKARADSIELVPYRAAIDAGVAAVMTAHIAFPALTGDSLPATLSGEILTGLLRDELGFGGIITTDAMDMGAIVRNYGTTVAPIMALRAGADLLLQVNPSDVGPVIDAIVAAVERGELTEARLDESVRRLLEAKARLGLHRSRTVDLARVPSLLATAAHGEVADDISNRSITVVRDRDRMLPLLARRVLSIVYADDPDPFAGRVLQRALAERLPGLRTALLDAGASAAELDAVRRQAQEADVILFSPFVRVRAYKGELAVAQQVGDLINEFARTRPTLVAAFGNPYLLSQFPAASTYLLAWGQTEPSQRAAARAITGQIAIGGRLPIPIPGVAAIGDGLSIPKAAGASPSSPLLRRSTPAPPPPGLAPPEQVGMARGLNVRIDSIVRVGILGGAAPGAAVAVGRHGQLVHLAGYGKLDLSGSGAIVTDSTIYDLASLTKVVATTTAVMVLYDDGKLDVDQPVSTYLPEWGDGTEKRRVTVRNLLQHDSGLPAWSALFRNVRGKHAFLERIAATPLAYEPGARTLYSDLGAILLGLIVERVSGTPLDVFVQERVFGPLGMRDTGFNPIWWLGSETVNDDGDEAALRGRIAPSETPGEADDFRFVQGNVHDENAYAIGGVAGHAGLFSSARDLAVFAQMILNGGYSGDRRIVREATVREFTRRASETSTRALGWDTPGSESSAGEYFSARSFGHTGFTGTSLWIDPERDVFVVLLTNRVKVSPDNQQHVPLRRDLADAVQKAIRDMPVEKRK
jgi:beta-glucosidase-like glycosyl hydrolase/CubicO group peptidase (beta-lactamase class C family)